MKKIFKKVVDAIDDLNIVRKAFRILYYVMGVIVGLNALQLPSLILIPLQSFGIDLVFSGWSEKAFWLMSLIWFCLMVCVCVVTFKYWKKHGDDIVNIKNRYPNITFVADFMQTYNNSFVFVFLSNIAVIAVLAYLFMALTGEFGFYHNGRFLLYLLGVAGVIIVAAIFAVLLIMLVSFITELLKRKIQMAMDLQDIADVVRVSEITKKEEN